MNPNATSHLPLFQNVLFYVLSDDIQKAKKKLSNANLNNTFDIVYVGNGDASVPGKKFCMMIMS